LRLYGRPIVYETVEGIAVQNTDLFRHGAPLASTLAQRSGERRIDRIVGHLVELLGFSGQFLCSS